MRNQLEKYLWQIEDQLAALPAEQRQEELREIRSHLEMMIDDNVTRGCDGNEAVTKAIEQFGAANKVGKDLMQMKPVSWLQWLRPIAAFVAAFVIMAELNSILNKVLVTFSLSFSFSWSWQLAWAITISVITGWIAEVIAPKKSLLPLAILFYGILGTLIYALLPNWYFTFAQLLFALVGIAAFLGVLIRRWQVERRQQQPQIIAE